MEQFLIGSFIPSIIDFLNFGIGYNRFPYFNIADSCITVGVIIIMILTLLQKEPESEPKATKKPARKKK